VSVEISGMPVEIGQIDKALGRLWEDSGDTKTRASLINLAISTEDPSTVAMNTDIIAQIASEHACRALLIVADPSAAESRASAWISAHCHLAGKGERQVCSEQVTFLLEGDLSGALTNIVFSHLDSDLPLTFWWQGDFPAHIDRKLWTWVDRLIFDSAAFQNPAEQIERVRRVGSLTDSRTVLCDLTWTRLLGTRFALAQLFDHACALERLSEIREVRIACAGRMTGLLLLGWLANQIGWRCQHLLGRDFFANSAGRNIEFSIEIQPGEPITRCEFLCDDSKLGIARESGSGFYHATICGLPAGDAQMLIPAGKSKPVDTLLMELARGGRHPLYAKSLDAVAALI